jgi:hypothetical protein
MLLAAVSKLLLTSSSSKNELYKITCGVADNIRLPADDMEAFGYGISISRRESV